MRVSGVFVFVFFFCNLFLLSNAQISNCTQLIAEAGYPVEVIVAETSDGFLLNIFHIPHGRSNNHGNPRPAVLLQHGLLDSACTWIVNLPEQSLAFILADAGFDVYLGNARGNTFSSGNSKLSPTDRAYWELIDFDNMIGIDLPTMINKVLEVSGQQNLTYIGHSQGTVMGFGAFPLMPDVASKVNVFIALAPVVSVAHQTSTLLTALSDLDLALWFYLFGEESFLPSDWIIDFFADTFCKYEPYACADVVFLLCGWNVNNLNYSRMPIYLEHTPAGTSVRNMLHWNQMVREKKFQKFDYGEAGNYQHYGTSNPPLYRPDLLTSPPVALFVGGQDDLADPADVQILIQTLPASNKPIVIHNEPTYEHLDFTWGLDAHIKIYPSVVQIAQKYSNM